LPAARPHAVHEVLSVVPKKSQEKMARARFPENLLDVRLGRH
jgi:hypothetical protein